MHKWEAEALVESTSASILSMSDGARSVRKLGNMHHASERRMMMPSRKAKAALLMIWAAYAILTFAVVRGHQGATTAVISAIGSISGPMTGALSRSFQSCCYDFSIGLLRYFLPFLAIAIGSQMLARQNESAWRARFRLAAWVFGWVGWFFGAVVSFFHALS